MNTKSKWLALFSILLVASMALAACAQPTPVVETIIETVVVEKEGETVVETVEVEVTVMAEQPAAPGEEGPIEVGEGNLVPCMPLPEVPESVSFKASAPSIVSDVPQTAIKPSAVLPQDGKVYRVGVFEDATSINFWAANGPDNTVWNSYMLPQRLALLDLTDKYFTLVPQIASELPPPLEQDGDFWVTTLPLRQDVLWSDGTSLTTADLVFSAETVLKFGLISGNWSNWFDAKFLDHVEAVDDYTLKIFYHTKPGYLRHEYGYLQSPIMNAAYWEPVATEAAAPIDALGDSPSEEDLAAAQAEAQDNLFAHEPDGEPTAGGFILEKWEKGAFMEESKFEDYYQTGVEITQWANAAYKDSEGTEVGTPEGDSELSYVIGPHVDATVYTYYGSQDAAILALKNGEVDYVINPLGLQRGLANQVRTDPNLTVLENNVNGFRYMSFNTRRAPMNDCSFRQAVATLIDKEFVTGTILQGVAFPLYTFVPSANAAWYFDDVPKIGQGLTREQRTNLARAILEQAGFTWEGGVAPTWDADNRQVTQAGRLLMPDGTPVPALNMPAPSPGYDPLRSTFAIWIETWLNEFGIPLTAQLAGFNVIVPIIFTEQDFDMYILGWSLGITPDFLYDFFAVEQAVEDGNNAGGYANPEFEETSSKLLTCENFDECKALSDKAQAILAEEVPYVLLFDTGIIEAIRSASVEYPFTTGLSGLQYFHQLGGDLQNTVNVK